MGLISPPTEAGRYDYERQHKKQIGRTFAIAAKSVTVEQFREFDKGYKLLVKYTRAADSPVVGISWHDAAAYCNWLSKKDDLPECYEMNATGQVTTLKARYLSLAGYRLPTEAEMEFAMRARALTGRCYGETEELLPKYAWYNKNSQEQTWPVGSLKPNDFGLFDVHGNVFTWCQDKHVAYPLHPAGTVAEDKEYELDINTDMRMLRGGGFFDRCRTCVLPTASALCRRAAAPNSVFVWRGLLLLNRFTAVLDEEVIALASLL